MEELLSKNNQHHSDFFHQRRKLNVGGSRWILSLTALCFLSCNFAVALPMQVTVTQRQSECLYELLNEKESVTISAFVLAGSKLMAEVQFQGPLVPSEVGTAIGLSEAVDHFDATGRHRHEHLSKSFTSNTDTLDFEHLKLGSNAEDEEESDDEEEGSEDEGDDDHEETAEERRERRTKAFQKAESARMKQEKVLSQQRKLMRQEGNEYVKTFKVESDGWYRFCVKATWNEVTVEIDFRKESEMGGLNDRGHVFSLEEKEFESEAMQIEQDSAKEEGIKDEDFASTQDKLKALRKLLSEIESKQKQERHRLIIHAATNEHSHSRMVLGSLIETVVFMAVTGVQIMTIRRWFQGASVLGR